MHPLGAGVQGGAVSARSVLLRYVLGFESVTRSSWRVLDVEEWA